MARRTYEKHSLGLALQSYLSDVGWTGVTFQESGNNQKQLSNPQITVSFVPRSSRVALQLGSAGSGSSEQSTFERIVQFDAYMETEKRAETIIDDIMDFAELETVSIIAPSGDTVGYMIVQDSESIYGDTLPPAGENPRIMKWRGVVRATYESYYPDS